MLGNRRNRSRNDQQECTFGCCRDGLPKKALRRILRHRETRTWQNEVREETQ